MHDILDKMNADPAILVSILLVISLILVAAIVVMLLMNAKMYRRYDFFMRGRDAESLEDEIVRMHNQMYEIQDQEMENRDRMKRVQFAMTNAYQYTGLVKYNAFEGMGGKSSFALAILDQAGTGIILNAMHSRTSCYLYVKEVQKGQPESELGAEEQEALNRALGK